MNIPPHGKEVNPLTVNSDGRINLNTSQKTGIIV